MNSIFDLSAKQLKQAADIKEKIAELESELSALLNSTAPEPAKRGPKKNGMSAAGRARIVAAQKARWAKVKADKGPDKAVKTAKRKMSAAGRAAIIAAQKARWAKVKAADKAK